MDEIGLMGLILILVNIAVSYQGFKKPAFFDEYKFWTGPIIHDKQYKRMVTSGFLHAGWVHLGFNMLTLYFFSKSLESEVGILLFLLIYFMSLIGGNLFSLLIHRNHGNYTAIGASGAVSGVIFACIALFPDMELGLLFLPIFIPSWLFGLIFIGVSIWGIKSQKGNIGHDAHLGGAIVGLIIAILIKPTSLVDNYLPILLVLIPSLVFIYLILEKPHMLKISHYKKSNPSITYSKPPKPKKKTVSKQAEMDRILDKIAMQGMDSLTKSEKKMLDDYSKK